MAEKANKMNRAIFGDWDGKLFKAYRMKDNESNLYIIDQAGVIRYYINGEINKTEIDNLKLRIANLIRDGNLNHQGNI